MSYLIPWAGYRGLGTAPTLLHFTVGMIDLLYLPTVLYSTYDTCIKGRYISQTRMRCAGMKASATNAKHLHIETANFQPKRRSARPGQFPVG